MKKILAFSRIYFLLGAAVLIAILTIFFILYINNESYTQAAIWSQWMAVGGLLFISVILLLAAGSIQKRIRQNRRLVTDIQELNTELYQSKEREQLKNRYLGIVTHDLRNPLHAVLSFSTILLEDEGSLNEEQVEYMGYIADSADLMKNLVAEMHEIQKIEEGAFGVKLENLRIHRILDGLVAGHKLHADEKGIDLCLHDDIREQVFTIDKSIFLQVADNLISNAIKFSPPGTRVDVVLDLFEGDLRLQVRDQGPGIRKEEIPYLFERFKKLSNKPTGNESTTGLGLSIVKDRVDAAGGTIHFENCEGGGSLFMVQFPQR